MKTTNIIDNILGKDKKEIQILGGRKVTGTFDLKGHGKSKASSHINGSKYTEVALTMDHLIIDKRYDVYWEKKNHLLLVAEPATKKWVFVASDKKITLKQDDTPMLKYADNRTIFLDALVLYLLIFNLNSEMTHSFKRIVNDYLKKKNEVDISMAAGGNCPVIAEEADVLLLCDSFLYLSMAEEDVFAPYQISNNTVASSIKAAISSGLLTKVDTPEFIKLGLAGEEATLNSKSKTGKKTENTPLSLYQRCMKGEFRLQIDWSPEMEAYIPPIQFLNDYVPCEAFFDIITSVSNKLTTVMNKIKAGENPIGAMINNVVNFTMYGRPGTGKTKTAYAIAAALGLPITSIPLNKRTDDDTYQGMTKAVDGAFLFKETPFLTFFKNGGIIVLEEINLADANNAMGCLGQALEFPYVLMENGFNPVKRNHYTVIVGTRNVGTYGSSCTSQALDSRFEQDYEINDPTENEFKEILLSKGYGAKEVNWVYKTYKSILNYLCKPEINADDIALGITLRSCIGALNGIADGVEPKRAIKNAMLGKISMHDPELGANIFTNIIDGMPDLILN